MHAPQPGEVASPGGAAAIAPDALWRRIASRSAASIDAADGAANAADAAEAVPAAATGEPRSFTAALDAFVTQSWGASAATRFGGSDVAAAVREADVARHNPVGLAATAADRPDASGTGAPGDSRARPLRAAARLARRLWREPALCACVLGTYTKGHIYLVQEPQEDDDDDDDDEPGDKGSEDDGARSSRARSAEAKHDAAAAAAEAKRSAHADADAKAARELDDEAAAAKDEKASESGDEDMAGDASRVDDVKGADDGARVEQYAIFVRGVLVGGDAVTDRERELLGRYRAAEGISDAEHARALRLLADAELGTARGRLAALQHASGGGPAAAGAPGVGVEPPQHLVCPITLDLFEDPVMTPFGHTFERAAIAEEIRRSGRCPLTKQPLRRRELRPNFAIRDAVDAHRRGASAAQRARRSHDGLGDVDMLAGSKDDDDRV